LDNSYFSVKVDKDTHFDLLAEKLKKPMSSFKKERLINQFIKKHSFFVKDNFSNSILHLLLNNPDGLTPYFIQNLINKHKNLEQTLSFNDRGYQNNTPALLLIGYLINKKNKNNFSIQEQEWLDFLKNNKNIDFDQQNNQGVSVRTLLPFLN
jgi:hypothetical protein